MTPSLYLIILLAIISFAYMKGKKRAFTLAGTKGGTRVLHSRPNYYGALTALWCGIPALLIFSFWLIFSDSVLIELALKTLPPAMQNLPPAQLDLLTNDLHNLIAGDVAFRDIDPVMQEAANYYLSLERISNVALGLVMFSAAIFSASLIYKKINPKLRARNHVEKIIKVILICCSTIAIFTTIGIVLSVLFESIRFFQMVPITDFLFGTHWSPQIAIRADQVGATGGFGAVPLLAGTFLIASIALSVAVPIGLMAAIYLSEYASPKVRDWAKPIMEILAGIPTVVYGFFAALMVAPFIRDTGETLGLNVSSESALAAGLVMGMMIIPYVSSLSDDVINAVPQSIRDGSYALGATKSETTINVVIPAALPGIVGSILLAASRAIGETMIVVMAAGLAANLTGNPLESVTTVTVQIVSLLVGDQEFDSPKTLAAFALGLLLFTITLVLNIIALYVVRRYREEYE